MSSPKWRPDNLQEHYGKRIQKDDDCWRELLKLDCSMTKDEYEKESYHSYDKGAIEYEAQQSRHLPALYRVDKRSVLTVASLSRRSMITCYHKHYNGKHEVGSTVPSIENLIEYIDDLEALIDGKSIAMSRINTVDANLSANQKRKYISPKLKILSRKCTQAN